MTTKTGPYQQLLDQRVLDLWTKLLYPGYNVRIVKSKLRLRDCHLIYRLHPELELIVINSQYELQNYAFNARDAGDTGSDVKYAGFLTITMLEAAIRKLLSYYQYSFEPIVIDLTEPDRVIISDFTRIDITETEWVNQRYIEELDGDNTRLTYQPDIKVYYLWP